MGWGALTCDGVARPRLVVARGQAIGRPGEGGTKLGLLSPSHSCLILCRDLLNLTSDAGDAP